MHKNGTDTEQDIRNAHDHGDEKHIDPEGVGTTFAECTKEGYDHAQPAEATNKKVDGVDGVGHGFLRLLCFDDYILHG